jgi:4-hydroxy-2-oxoheptanedioate aldolase
MESLMTTMRGRVLNGELMVGTFGGLSSSALEVMANAGFDFVCLDAEHSPHDRAVLEHLIRAAEIAKMPPMVRVPGHGAEAIAGALDSGAQAILVPRVNNASEAAAVVSAFRYPPQGKRGAGPGRSTLYGASVMEYVAKANDSLMLAVQVESAEAVENLESIVKVEGIDLIFIGPGDLSISLGLTRAEDQEKLTATIRHIVSVCRAAAVPVGLFRLSPADLESWLAAGVTFFIIGSDGIFLANGAAACAKAAREAAARHLHGASA